MPRLVLMGSIQQYAGGLRAAEVEGATVRTAIASLERSHPALKGWVVDEQGALRRHVKLFLRGEAASLDTALARGDELHIVAAISGG
jgi:molybdopterin converting factor small subunit